jgi:hypothetical protein
MCCKSGVPLTAPFPRLEQCWCHRRQLIRYYFNTNISQVKLKASNKTTLTRQHSNMRRTLILTNFPNLPKADLAQTPHFLTFLYEPTDLERPIC